MDTVRKLRRYFSRRLAFFNSMFYTHAYMRFSSYLRAVMYRYGRRNITIALIVLITFLGIGIGKSIYNHSASTNTHQKVSSVEIRRAKDALLSSSINITGIVRSKEQGDLRIQVPGLVTGIYTTVGTEVYAGQLIAEVENNSQKASVAQARAGVDQAQAQYDKIVSGTRSQQLSILKLSTQTAKAALEKTITQAQGTLQSAYAASDSAFYGGVDALFTDPTKTNPLLNVQSTSAKDVLIAQNMRFSVQQILNRQSDRAKTISTVTDIQTLQSELKQTHSELQKEKETLDAILVVLNSYIETASFSASTATSFRAIAESGRSNIIAKDSQVVSINSALIAANNAYMQAVQSEKLGLEGAQKEDVQLAKAQLDAAKAGYAQAVAQLEKTRVRASVNGTLVSLSIEKGDFVSAYQNVGLVANAHSMEVTTYVDQTIADQLTIGDSAMINGTQDAKVVSIAPGIDTVNRQRKVILAIEDTSDTTQYNNLISGDRVSVTFNSTVADLQDKNTQKDNNQSMDIRVPLSALKLTGDTAYVFTVDANNILKKHSVVLGTVLQNSVEIMSGISPDDFIVLDARGKSEGDTVVVINE